MLYLVNDIMRDVRIAMDENKTNEQLITETDIDTLMLDEIIRSKIVEAVRRAIIDAPIHLLDGGVPFGDSIYWRKNNSGWTILPDDFLRLLFFKMSDWERPVYAAITAADPQYAVQSSRYAGLRGTPQKPVVAIVRKPVGLVLELYSCKDDTATVEEAMYMPMPKIDEDGGISIPERCYKSVVYLIAALVLATIGQNELSSVLNQLSKDLLI